MDEYEKIIDNLRNDTYGSFTYGSPKSDMNWGDFTKKPDPDDLEKYILEAKKATQWGSSYLDTLHRVMKDAELDKKSTRNNWKEEIQTSIREYLVHSGLNVYTVSILVDFLSNDLKSPEPMNIEVESDCVIFEFKNSMNERIIMTIRMDSELTILACLVNGDSIKFHRGLLETEADLTELFYPDV